MDWDMFYSQHIPKSCLPSDFGGDLESIADLHEKQCKEFQRSRDFFVLEEQQAALKLDDLASEKQILQNELILESDRGVKNATIDWVTRKTFFSRLPHDAHIISFMEFEFGWLRNQDGSEVNDRDILNFVS